MTLFSQAGSRNYANHTAKPEKDLERKTSDTSGRKCLEQFERFNRVGLWAKTFSALLIGTGDWYSTRCKLTWKLRGTKYNRMYFQLVPSTLPTDGTGFGLLPTPRAIEIIEHPMKQAERLKDRTGNKLNNLSSAAKFGMLPTPTATDVHHAERVQALKETGAQTMASRKNGPNRPNGLMDYLDFNQMLPTPRSRAAGGNCSNDRGKGNLEDRIAQLLSTPMSNDWKGRQATETWKGTSDLCSVISKIEATGKTSQLNPQFVMEMMGFPPDWTILPFLNGETNQSKPEEMQ